jgi:3-oxoacyl-[acyl-carrier-protein] synthase-3
MDTSDEWIFSRTGIKSRHLSTDESLTDLSESAALQALQAAGLKPQDIDVIICATIRGDYRTPSLASCLAGRLEATCPAFDINAACTGFLYALDLAGNYLQAGRAQNILIVSAEMMSTQVDWTDRNTCVLFGDGAAACVVAKGEALKYLSLRTAPQISILNLPVDTGNSPFAVNKRENSYLYMNGQEVFRFAVNAVEEDVKETLHALALSADQIDYFILHQANQRIIDSIRRKLGQPEEKFPLNIARYGNISSVSIPLLLQDMLESRAIKAGDRLFLSAFGAGMTTGSCVMEWE